MTAEGRKQYAHLYNSRRWREKREHQLSIEPLCRMCAQVGRVTAATVADHVVPHKGSLTLFWSGALQSLCKSCHDSHKQREERSGRAVGCDINGRPFASVAKMRQSEGGCTK